MNYILVNTHLGEQMNKFAKGAVAAGAATLLLLGGAGTLAYWNDTATLQGSNITAGDLKLTAAAGSWAPAITTWVPGDTSSYTTNLTLTATGDHMRGEITMDASSITVTPTAAANQFTVKVEAATAPLTNVTFDAATQKFTIAGPTTGTFPVKITVEFPYTNGTEQNASKNAAVDLSAVKFNVKQTAATGAVTQP